MQNMRHPDTPAAPTMRGAAVLSENTPKPPRWLYKYCPPQPEKRAEENLRQRVLFFNSPAYFNDWYDCRFKPPVDNLTAEQIMEIRESYIRRIPEEQRDSLPVPTRDQFIAHIKIALAKKWDEFRASCGISCFSECHNNLLMWSLYGGDNRGFCLAFDTQDAQLFGDNMILRQVKYGSIPPYANAVQILKNDREHFYQVVSSKPADWRHEREWRLIQRKRGGLVYNAAALRFVYFGPEATEKMKERISAIVTKGYPHVELWQAQFNDEEYKLDFTLLP